MMLEPHSWGGDQSHCCPGLAQPQGRVGSWHSNFDCQALLPDPAIWPKGAEPQQCSSMVCALTLLFVICCSPVCDNALLHPEDCKILSTFAPEIQSRRWRAAGRSKENLNERIFFNGTQRSQMSCDGGKSCSNFACICKRLVLSCGHASPKIVPSSSRHGRAPHLRL